MKPMTKGFRSLIFVGAALIGGVLFSATAVASNIYYLSSAGALHWGRGSKPWARVVFVDHTSSRWPVTTKADAWNATSTFGAYYSWNTCPSSIGPCVHVREGNYAFNNRGYAYFAWDSNAHFVAGNSTRVELNNTYAVNGTLDAAATCQELGHIIGLDHTSATSSCMSATTSSATSTVPGSHDLSEMTSVLYDH